MAKKTKPLSPMLNAGVLLIAGLIILFIAYRQIVQGGQLQQALPTAALTQALQTCVAEHASPDFVRQGLAQVDQGRLAASLWQQLSRSLLDTQVEQNHIDEIKVLRIRDLWAKNAEVRVTGVLELVATAPIVGRLSSRYYYTTTLIKNQEQWHFNRVAVRANPNNDWQHWDCVQSLVATP